MNNNKKNIVIYSNQDSTSLELASLCAKDTPSIRTVVSESEVAWFKENYTTCTPDELPMVSMNSVWYSPNLFKTVYTKYYDTIH